MTTLGTRIRALTGSFALLCAPLTLAADPAPFAYEGIDVTWRGEGRDLVFIPGLLSAGEVFDELCASLAEVRCHLLHLPGFAGLDALPDLEQGFLEPVAARLARYLDAHTQAPLIVGHSLGGWLALRIALDQPEAVSGLLLVDALPYFPAAQNPNASPELMRPLAEGILAGMATQTDAQFEQQLPMQLQGMTRDPARTATLSGWALASDRATMARAMYDMQLLDLRPRLPELDTPVMILGAWAAYGAYGFSQDSVRGVFESQYQGLSDKEIQMSEAGYHFLMWDDPDWLRARLNTFLRETAGGND